MTLVELLEKDRDSLIGEIENAPRPAEAQEILEKEADRLLYQYNEAENEEIKRLAASDLMQVVRVALPLVDSTGDSIVWTTGKKDKKQGYALSVGLLAGGAAVLIFVLLSGRILTGAFSILYKLITLAGFGLFLSGGFLLGKKRGGSSSDDPSRQKVENHVDAKALYRTLHGMVQIADQNIERAAERESTMPSADTTQGKLTDAEISLYAGLMEALYSGDGEMALDKLNDIKYFLHRNEIDAVDYGEGKKEWFDVMPSKTEATIRPAIVSHGILLKKGLAAGGQ